MDILRYNREAWNHLVDEGNQWTIPVTPEQVAEARKGNWSLELTPTIPVPSNWFGDVKGRDILCLASGGGQQGPILAAAGAHVTVFDNSPRQLERDRQVAERESLEIRLVQGDMADLSVFTEEGFDLVFHPVSNCFSAQVLPVWKECHRVLRPGGTLLAGFNNPALYIFDMERLDEGELVVRYSLPYSDQEDLPDDQKQRYLAEGGPFEFSHNLNEQIGGQIAVGFVITGFYEDIDPTSILGKTFPTFFATRAVKN